MRILFLSPQPFFRARGTPFNVRALTRVLCEAGHEVDLLVYPYGEDVECPGLRLLRIWRPPGIRDVKIGPSAAKIPLDAVMAMSALRLTLTRRYDVVHAVEEAVFIARVLRILRGIPYVYDMDSHITDQLRYSGFLKEGRFLRWIERRETNVVRNAECVITVCRALTDAARRMAPDARIFQIEDAPIDEGDPSECKEKAEMLRRNLGLAGRRIVVYTGNLESYQGIDLLVGAFGKVAKKRPEAVLLLVGGEAQDVETVRDDARRLGIGDRVILAGRRPPGEMGAYLALADCLVSPRKSGTNTPLKIFTYMRSGRPIVATDSLTHTQVLDDKCAVLVPGNAEGIADGILRVLEDPVSAGMLADNARRRVETQYSADAFRRRVIEAYDWLAARLGKAGEGISPP